MTARLKPHPFKTYTSVYGFSAACSRRPLRVTSRRLAETRFWAGV